MKILKEKVYLAKSDRNSTIFYNWAIVHDLVQVQKKKITKYKKYYLLIQKLQNNKSDNLFS